MPSMRCRCCCCAAAAAAQPPAGSPRPPRPLSALPQVYLAKWRETLVAVKILMNTGEEEGRRGELPATVGAPRLLLAPLPPCQLQHSEFGWLSTRPVPPTASSSCSSAAAQCPLACLPCLAAGMDIEDADDAERALTLSNPVLESLQKVRQQLPLPDWLAGWGG